MRKHQISDQELIASYQSGNHRAFETIINKYKNRIFGYILMIVKNKDLAEDIFQDTFIKVINKVRSGSYKEEGKFLQWTMRIAHNLTIDHFRKSKRIPVISNDHDDFDVFDTISNYDPSVEEEIITAQIHEDVRKIIEFLPEEQKQVLIMRHYKRMSFKDIADSTDVSINTALGRMRYALINLRKLVKEKNISLTV